MKQVVFVLVASTLLISGCLRSSMLVVHQGEGRAIVTDTILMHVVMLASIPGAVPDSLQARVASAQSMLEMASLIDPEFIVRRLPFWTNRSTTITSIDSVVDGDFVGVVISATVPDIRETPMIWMDVVGRGGPQDTADLISFSVDDDGGLVAHVSPRTAAPDYPDKDVDSIPDSDLAQFRIFGRLTAVGMRFNVRLAQDGDTSVVLSINGEKGLDLLSRDDGEIERFLLIRQRSDQEIIDYIGSIPDSIVDIPSVSMLASPELLPMSVDFSEPAVTKEDSLSAILNRIGFTTTSPNIHMFSDIPPEERAMLITSEIQRISTTPLQFGGDLDTLIRELRQVGAEIDIADSGKGRTVCVHQRDTWHRRYDLREEPENGLISATEHAWFAKEPRFRLERMKEYYPDKLRQSGARDIEINAMSDTLFHATYIDQEFGPMEDRVFIRYDPGQEPDKPWALVSIRRLLK